ncbi:MAG: tyrosine-type recombinase/integrase, partial [Asticcacaulis sp.]
RNAVAARVSAANTFKVVADEFIAKIESGGLADATRVKTRWLAGQLEPDLGKRPVSEIEPFEVLAVLKKIERKGNHETAKRVRAFASRIFRYAIITSRARTNPAAELGDALITPKVKHHAAILEPKAVGELLRAIEAFEGFTTTALALKIAPHLYVRPGELRHAEWSEFDFEEAVWRIPAGKMKMQSPHHVPLSRQSLAILSELRGLTCNSQFVFPSIRTPLRPMSENTLNVALRRLGYGHDEMTAHGFRSTASTLLNESGKWHPDAIERALAHKDSDAVRSAYHRGAHWKERFDMAQWWSDYLDRLRDGGELLPFPARAS